MVFGQAPCGQAGAGGDLAPPLGPGPRRECSGPHRLPTGSAPCGERHGGTGPPPLATRATLTPSGPATPAAGP
ncbi:hypothetical protein DV515_00019808 [Chloebia gouldiae]|uniref:Uncharacterized protein n=1 Tax=Chloebia gouldiae TaxID=44316 RepID=A0A3L8Q3P3_CHLGU|nr:hypothetical protein DV515_00019808 [Chloebia gouldiae]